MAKYTIPYCPTAYARKVIHPALESHSRSVLVCHRRYGKTVLVINHMIKMAIKCKKRMPVFAYIAPYRKQAKTIAWSYLKYYLHVLPGITVNESELYVEFASMHKGCSGARIYIMGADNPDSARGLYFDGVVLDEPAQIKSELWDEVILPALMDRNGWAVFIGTPKGQNQFYEIWQKAQRDDKWYACMIRCDESGLFDAGGRYGPEALETLKAEMSETKFRQEMLCDFTASCENVLITIDEVTESAGRTYTKEDVGLAPVIFGVDVARYGDDSCVITRRQGLVCYEPQVYRDIDNMTFAAYLMREIDKHRPDAVFVDAGRGEGVIDRCRQMGYDVTEVNFGSRALNPERYINKRVEMWDEMHEWIKSGGALPNVPELKSELVVPEYSFDAAGRMKLSSKEEIKEIMGKSPDIADSLALTFAYPVQPKGFISGTRRAMCNVDFDLYDD